MNHSEQAYLIRFFFFKLLFSNKSYSRIFFSIKVKFLFCKTNSLCCLVIGVFYAKIWVPQKGYIDKRTCSNTCFDTIFRGL